MSLTKICFFIGMFLCLSNSWAQEYYYNYQGAVSEAAEEIYAFRFDRGAALLNAEKEKHPENLAVWHIENYIDFLKLALAADEEQVDAIEANYDRRIEALEKGPKTDPYYRYALAEVNLHWAVIYGKTGSYFTSFRRMRRGYKLILENRELFPEFTINLLPLGFIQAMVGTVPPNYEWAVNSVGLHGDYATGVANLEKARKAINSCDTLTFLQPESLMFASLLYNNISGEREKIEQLTNFITSTYGSTPDALGICSILAASYLKLGKSDSAIVVLDNCSKKPEYNNCPQLDYMLGKALLQKIDPRSIEVLNRFIAQNSSAYRASTYQLIARYYLVTGNSSAYNHYMKKVLTDKRCNTIIYSDKEAVKMAKKEEIPNPYLMKVRLLFDGGYYKRALDVLNSSDTQRSLTNKRERLEALYREGRIADAAGDTEHAITAYSRCIEQGEELPYYFAANSALKLGNIFEHQGKLEQANRLYNRCIEMDFDTYRNGIIQKAKAGKARIENRI